MVIALPIMSLTVIGAHESTAVGMAIKVTIRYNSSRSAQRLLACRVGLGCCSLSSMVFSACAGTQWGVSRLGIVMWCMRDGVFCVA